MHKLYICLICTHTHIFINTVAWRYDVVVNVLVVINEVTLHWAGLMLGWVTVCRRVNHLGM